MLPSYDLILEDDEQLSVGDLRLKTLATPGHTPGSICFAVEGTHLLFSGDTLFPGGPGQHLFEDADFDTIIASIDRRIFAALSPTPWSCPGHGTSTTVGNERLTWANGSSELVGRPGESAGIVAAAPLKIPDQNGKLLEDDPHRPLLEIRDLHVSAEDGAILRGVDLTVGAGEIHALMGPNGAGKSTLAGALMGHPAYRVTSGSIRCNGEDVTGWPTDVRAKAGLFLAFQYPETIEGVSVTQFLRQAMAARKGTEEVSVLEVRVLMTEWMERLGMDTSFASRHLNQGFSGGEKKRNEILQMALLEPLRGRARRDRLGPRHRRAARGGPRRARRARGPARARRAGHHPLPAPARGAGARRGPPADGRAHRGQRRARAGRAGRGRGLRGLAMTPDAARRRRAGPLNVEALRKDFPLLARTVHGRPIVYLDSASSALQPQAVIGAMSHYYETTHANVHRGVYATAEEATALYERARVVAGVHRRAGPGARDRLHQEHHRVAQPGGPLLGPRQPARRRRRAADRDGAPRQHRPLADAGRGARGLELRYLPSTATAGST